MFFVLLILKVGDLRRHLLCFFPARVDVPLVLLDSLLLVIEARRYVVINVREWDLGVLREDLQHKQRWHQAFLVDVYVAQQQQRAYIS